MAGRLWVLGASDPEMNEIENLLREAGEAFAYALDTRGERVSPATAYKAVKASAEIPADAAVYLVECEVDGLTNEVVVRIDHHRPGDPGFGRPPAEFLAASSLGQVVCLLGRLDALPDKFGEGNWLSDEESLNPVSGAFLWAPERDAVGPGWAHRAPAGWVTRCGAYVWTVPPAIVLAAAADHCLAAAYRGKCPGVDPDALMRWRAESRARYQGRSVEDVLADVERAQAALQSARRLDLVPGDPCCQFLDCPECGGYGATGGVNVRDLRGQHVPELPEAATRLGIGYVADGLPDRDGRVKIVCSGDAEQVRAFLEVWGPSQGLVVLYGDPARGFAGGYLP